jgi:hypothetical protein
LRVKKIIFVMEIERILDQNLYGKYCKWMTK